ncbi:hypothetical protein [Kordia sp.]|uniref:hypothetical protein n=1 Tax=Kordia sp. TaxID=1965332 RepID=UPI003D278DF2
MTQVENKKQLIHHILYGVFLVLFLLEPLVKIFYDPNSNIRVKAILKLTLLAILVGYTIFLKIKKEVLIFLIILGLSFLIGQYVLIEKHSIFGSNLLKEAQGGDIYIFIKYMYILFFVGVYEKITTNENLTERLVNLFNGFMIINTIFIGIGLITKWELFKSYPYTTRFGYQGLIELAGESIHLYTIAISLAYIKYVKTKKYGLLVFFLLGGLMLGKKAIFLYLLLLVIVHLCYLKKKKILYGMGFLTILAIVFHKFVIAIFIKIFPFWQNLYESDGLVTVIFSKRNILFEESLHYIQTNWNPINYIFGGIDFASYRSEFGFFDLFLAVGILGIALYFWFIYKYFLSKQATLVKTVFIIIFITEAFSGGLIINIIPMIFLYLIAKHLERNYTTTT